MIKKVILFISSILIVIAICFNYSMIYRDFRKLHLFNSAELLKSSSFDEYTIDVFQSDGEISLEVYSSYSWFTNVKDIVDSSTQLSADNVSVTWKKIKLSSDIDVILVFVGVTKDNQLIQYYNAALSNSEEFSATDILETLKVDVNENPTQVD